MEAAQQRYRVAYDSITRLCGLGLPDGELFTRVSGQLRTAVGFRTAGWLRLDPVTLLPMPGLLLQADHDRARQIIHNEYFEPDVVKFRELARWPVPAESLWRSVAADWRYARSGSAGTWAKPRTSGNGGWIGCRSTWNALSSMASMEKLPRQPIRSIRPASPSTDMASANVSSETK